MEIGMEYTERRGRPRKYAAGRRFGTDGKKPTRRGGLEAADLLRRTAHRDGRPRSLERIARSLLRLLPRDGSRIL